MLEGNWTYRSFYNNPQKVGDNPEKTLQLIFGEGNLSFTSSTDRIFKAALDFGGGAAMDLHGVLIQAAGINPLVLQITGTGREGTSTAKWVYQYQGYVVPEWAEGVNQTPAIRHCRHGHTHHSTWKRPGWSRSIIYCRETALTAITLLVTGFSGFHALPNERAFFLLTVDSEAPAWELARYNKPACRNGPCPRTLKTDGL